MSSHARLRLASLLVASLAAWPASAQEPAAERAEEPSPDAAPASGSDAEADREPQADAESSPTAEPAPEGESAPAAAAEPAPEADPADDGWPDLSAFLDEKFGFLPLAQPITEPAVGYGAGGGLAFLSKSFGDARAGLGRPNVTFVGGMGTANGSWGTVAADSRYWLDDRLHTLAVGIYSSVNLDYYGTGDNDVLEDDPLRYNLNPRGLMLQGKYRFGESSFWAGVNARFISTAVDFDAPASTPELPDYRSTTNLGGAALMGFYDTRDNIFTTLRGTYLELGVGMYGAGSANDGPFEKVELVGMQFVPLPHRFYLGFRAELGATFGDAPFYFRPYVGLRGVPVMRYQGEEIAQLEAELRWQFWGRWSLVGFVGGGGAWNQLEQFDSAQGVVAGGGGFRYELARTYGIHMGLDVAASAETVAFYIQVGSAWARP